MAATILWRRLFQPGHDACRLLPHGLEGMATWPGPAAIHYGIECDAAWLTRRVLLEGFVGDRDVAMDIRRGSQGWSVNGTRVPGLEDAVDIDLGFTPATNTLPIRRLGLGVGQSADLLAAWIDPRDWTLKPLPQAYHRLGADQWRYASGNGSGFAAGLTVTTDGLVRQYEGLWAEETADGA